MAVARPDLLSVAGGCGCGETAAAVTIAASPAPSKHAQRKVYGSEAFGLRGVVSDARGRDHESMSSTTTISSYEQACLRHRREAPDGCNIAAHAFASSDITGRVWAPDGSQGM
jgi:hypothetical protein